MNLFLGMELWNGKLLNESMGLLACNKYNETHKVTNYLILIYHLFLSFLAK